MLVLLVATLLLWPAARRFIDEVWDYLVTGDFVGLAEYLRGFDDTAWLVSSILIILQALAASIALHPDGGAPEPDDPVIVQPAAPVPVPAGPGWNRALCGRKNRTATAKIEETTGSGTAATAAPNSLPLAVP